MFLVILGTAIGLLLSLAVGRLSRSLLLGIEPLDLITHTAAILLLTAVGLAGSYVPVRRATRINAMEALRHE
jgi:ABC-type antimicrobial peptide transport system permease subunit